MGFDLFGISPAYSQQHLEKVWKPFLDKCENHDININAFTSYNKSGRQVSLVELFHGIPLKDEAMNKEVENIVRKISGLPEKAQHDFKKMMSKVINENEGFHFYNNVWYWHPLAEYIGKFTGEIQEKNRDAWHCNDFYEVKEDVVLRISSSLEALIKHGHTEKEAIKWAKMTKKAKEHNHQKVMPEIEKLFRKYEMNQEYKIADNLLGIRITFEQFEDKLKSEDKKKLFSLLDQYQPQADFNFEVENVQDFIQFCKMSGGFCIA